MLLILQDFAAGVQQFCQDPNVLSLEIGFNAGWFLLCPQFDLSPPTL